MKKQIEEMARLMCEGCANHGDCKYDTCDATLDEAKRLYNAGYRNQEWISVEDRLPNEYTRVIGCVIEKVRIPVSGECYRVGNRFHFSTLGYNRPISYWMPLPEPPKGKQK